MYTVSDPAAAVIARVLVPEVLSARSYPVWVNACLGRRRVSDHSPGDCQRRGHATRVKPSDLTVNLSWTNSDFSCDSNSLSLTETNLSTVSAIGPMLTGTEDGDLVMRVDQRQWDR